MTTSTFLTGPSRSSFRRCRGGKGISQPVVKLQVAVSVGGKHKMVEIDVGGEEEDEEEEEEEEEDEE